MPKKFSERSEELVPFVRATDGDSFYVDLGYDVSHYAFYVASLNQIHDHSTTRKVRENDQTLKKIC